MGYVFVVEVDLLPGGLTALSGDAHIVRVLLAHHANSEQEKRGGTYIDPQHTQACRKDESQTHKWINRLPYGTTERAYDSPRVHCSIQDAGLVGGDQQ